MAIYVDVPSGGGSTTDHEQIRVVFDGFGLAIDAGTKVYVPYMPAGTIIGWEMVSDVSGSCVIDIWKRAYSAGMPTVAHTITASAKPTLSSAQQNFSTTMSGWTGLTIADDDILCFNVDSCTTITKVTLVLKVLKS